MKLQVISRKKVEEAIPLQDCSGREIPADEREDIIRHALWVAEIQRDFDEDQVMSKSSGLEKIIDIDEMLYYRISRGIKITHGGNKWSVLAEYAFGDIIEGFANTLPNAIERCYKKVKRLTTGDKKANECYDKYYDEQATD